MIVYVPGRMPAYAARLGATANYYGQQQQQQQQQQQVFLTYPPSPPASPTTHQLLTGWPRRMPQDEEMLVVATGQQPQQLHANVVVNGPPSPAHSDSDASSSSLELGSVRRAEHAQLKCKWLNCGRWFTSLDQLARHVGKVHAEPGPRGLFYCGWEGCQRGERGFNARYKMLVHVRTHTNEKPHRCFQCDKSFSRAENLKIHARSHTGERPYACPVEGCNKAYSNSSDRFKHSRTHAVDKPYCCKIPGCPKRYTDPSSLRKHVKTYRHYVNNNNDKSQEDAPMPMAGIVSNNKSGGQVKSDTSITTNSDKRSSISHSSDSDKKDSSLESNTTSTSLGSISESPKAALSTSFEEQQKLVEWNNLYNLKDQQHHQQQQQQQQPQEPRQISPSPSSSLSLSLSSSKSSYEHEIPAGRYSRSSLYEDYIIPERHLPVLKQPTPTYPHQHHLQPVASPPDHLMATTPRIGMQSTPIKSEDKASGVDYRNIDSIVNSSSTPMKKEYNIAGDVVRNSVIKRADTTHIQSPVTAMQQEQNTTSDCCCKHKCCRHAENDSLLEKTKILSDLILKSQNPLFRHLLASVDLQYGLQNMWSSSQQTNVPEANTCAQDLRAKSAESLPTDMEQDLPLDLTINK